MARLDRVLADATPGWHEEVWFECLYTTTTRAAVHSFAQAMARGNTYLADEAEQLAMITAWLTGVDKYDPERGTVATWVKELVSTFIRDLRVAIERRNETSLTLFESVDILPRALVYEADWAEDEGLVEFVDALEPDEYKALDMYHTKGYSQSQIAEELGVSRQTVNTKIQKAKAKLREVMVAT